MKSFGTLFLVCLSFPLLAQQPSLPGACPAIVEGRSLPFFAPDPKVVLSAGTLAKILQVRSAPASVARVTLLDQLGEILLADPLFKAAYLGTADENSRPAIQRLAGQLIQPQSENYLVQLIALTELELIRNYSAGYLGAMARMAEIIDSDSYYGVREEAIRRERGLTLVHRLIVARETESVAEIMKQYYVDQHSTDSAPHPK